MPLLPFPPGDNLTDAVIDGTHYNLTTLLYWNYTLYSNNTLSNGSTCLLIFEPYTAFLLPNGTFLNSTSCYSPIRPLQTRSQIGLFFACFFIIGSIFTFINLRKHGRLFLPIEKRFLPIGRRWQWYWMLATAACAIVSGFGSIDVDRYYLPELPLVLFSVCWLLMLAATMCAVWESVRHWGSWQERQMMDGDPFILGTNDLRTKIQLYIPLVFYLFVTLNVFMIVPRSWGNIELQRDPDQSRLSAAPFATDLIFKIAAFMLLGAWLTTIFSLLHSIKHYKLDRSSNMIDLSMVGHFPTKFFLTLGLSLAMIGYEIACSFDFSISPMNLDANLGVIYGLGWGLPTLIFVVSEAAAFIDPNEDRELIRQRRLRNAEAQRDRNFPKKPHRWSRNSKSSPSVFPNDPQRPRTKDVRRKVPTSSIPNSVELQSISDAQIYEINSKDTPESKGRLRSMLLPSYTEDGENERFVDDFDYDISGRPGEAQSVSSQTAAGSSTNGRSGSTSTSVTIVGQHQQVRSMLDI